MCFRLFNSKEKKQCERLGIDLKFSQKKYHNRQIPKLYFTRDYAIKDKYFQLKGDEYSTYMWSYDRMAKLIKSGVISEY